MLDKFAFLANFDASTPVAFFKSDFIAELGKCNSSFILFLLRIYGSGK